MSRPASFLSRPPRTEPPLHIHADRSADSCTQIPSPRQTPHRSPHTGVRRPQTLVGSDAETLAAARRFTEHALRLTLEVLDHRRAPQQLRAFLEPTLIDTVRVLAHTAPPGRALGTATLERIHLSMVDPTTAEVFGTYSRGDRVFAIAARVTHRPRNQGWRMTTLRIA